jgi:hypothetical protein
MSVLTINVPLYLTEGCTPLQNMKSSNIRVAAIGTNIYFHGHAGTTDGVWCNKHASLRRDKPGSADASISKTHEALQISPLRANREPSSCCVTCFGYATHFSYWLRKIPCITQGSLVKRKF